MNELAEILEHELEDAVEVKNKKSLHRFIVLLTDIITQENNYQQNTDELKSDIKVLAETMKEGFTGEDMNDLAEILEHEFEDAVVVKNKKSLHRHIVLLTSMLTQKSSYWQNSNEFESDIEAGLFNSK